MKMLVLALLSCLAPVVFGAAPDAVAWQNKNNDAIAAATCDEALAAVVKDEAAADRLLAEVKGAYLTDPMVATKIAAVSQYVMKKTCCREKARKIWTEALLRRAAGSNDAYVSQFCIDQLRWCGYSSQAKALRALAKGKQKEVFCIAEMAAKELESK